MAIGAGGLPQVRGLWVTEAPSKVEAGQSPLGVLGVKPFKSKMNLMFIAFHQRKF